MLRFVALVVLAASACSGKVAIVHPQQGEAVVAKDASVWVEFTTDGFDISAGHGSASIFVNGEYYQTTHETALGLEISESGPLAIEIQLRDAEENEVDRAGVQIDVTIPPPAEGEEKPKAEPLRYVPLEGDTMPFGSIILISPKPGSVIAEGPMVVKYRLKQVPNSQISAVHILFNRQQEVYVFEGMEEGEITIPTVPVGTWTITARLGGHPNHVALEMEATSEFTVVSGSVPAADEALVGEAIEAELREDRDGNLILAAGGDQSLQSYEDFLVSLRSAGCQADVILFPAAPVKKEIIDLAKKHSATIIPLDEGKLPSACKGDVGSGIDCARFFAFRASLLDRIADYGGSRILLTETDTIFQSDPFRSEGLDSDLVYLSPSAQLIIEDDDEFSALLSEQCEMLPESTLTRLASKPALWSGVVSGSFERILEEVDSVCELLLESTTKRSKKFADIPAREYVNSCHHQGVWSGKGYRAIKEEPNAVEPNYLTSEDGPVFIAHRWPSIRIDADGKILLPAESNAPAAFVVGAHKFSGYKRGSKPGKITTLSRE